MAVFKCKMCGGDLEVAGNEKVAECDYCGTTQTIPSVNDEKLQGLFNRANILRMKSEFDKAEALYEKIIQTDETQAEAYWGLILCKFGVEYVEDPETFKRIPTCHRTLLDSIIADDDYKSALKYADAMQKAFYENEAKEIDRLQKDILALSKKEEPYDVFICYKETDDNGERTQDSVIANDIYYQLTQEGLKVFYAAVTLEDKIGSAYEPYIFAALNSAKVMLVIGTKPEYFNAVWVKNEWSRYLKIVQKDRSKMLVPCYRDMDAYELPEEFAHIQAQNMSKIGFINDVVRSIKKLTADNEEQPKAVKETVVSTGSNGNTETLLKRVFMFLEDGDWNSANEYCEKVLDIEPENARAYLGKLMANMLTRKFELLKDCRYSFDDDINYEKIMRFGDEELKTTLAEYIAYINERNENERLEKLYASAKEEMEKADAEEAYKSAAEIFESVSEYKDSSALAKAYYEKIEELRRKAEEARKDAIIADGKANMTLEAIANYEEAIELFKSVSDWKDADENIVACQKKIDELKAKEEAERLEFEHQVQIAREKAEKRRKILAITTPIICIAIVVGILLNYVIIPNGKYNNAIAFIDAGNNVEAYEALISLDGYKDSSDIASSIYDKLNNVEKLKVAKTGDYVFFGAYEQDNNNSNGKEAIEWLVLDIKDGKTLLISKYALDSKQYNTSSTDVTWESCTLRKWLNSDFLNAAFSADERTMIPTVTVSADKNPEYSTSPGNETQDQVFLLSITEANKYFTSDSARVCKPTAYALVNGPYESDSGNCWWWLRSPGGLQYRAAHVDHYGGVNESGSYVIYSNVAVRPALWINLDS